jgi:hypothetical protein
MATMLEVAAILAKAQLVKADTAASHCPRPARRDNRVLRTRCQIARADNKMRPTDGLVKSSIPVVRRIVLEQPESALLRHRLSGTKRLI